MKKSFILSLHSYVDVITNSSSELFMTADQRVVEFFKEMIKENGREKSSSIKILTYQEFAKQNNFEELKEDNPTYFEENYGQLKETDMILTINYSTDDGYEFIYELTDLFNMRSLYD